jgi:hypothetical protein
MIDLRRTARLFVLAFSIVLLCLSGGADQEKKPEPKAKPKQKKERPVRVLFLGGSYTYYNNLPDIFGKVAQAGGAGVVETGMVALPGWSLKDHWQKGDAHQVLREKDWNFVVLEDESLLGTGAGLKGAASGAAVEAFRPYARNWAQVIQDVKSVPVFFLTWAPKAAPDSQADLNAAYFSAAKETESRVAPVGIAWAQVREKHPEIELYAADGIHPSPAGNYLAACALFTSMFRRNPEGIPARAGGRPVDPATGKVLSEKLEFLVDLPPAQAKILQQAAWEAQKLLDKNRGYLDFPKAPER